ncbi:5'-methylthioadenosine/S-adenosylhomocysteine nucleosidase [subsurface metagenome]
MKLLIICPIPVEFNTCREILRLRDTTPLLGCRTGRSVLGDCEIISMESGPAKVRAASAAVAGCFHYSPDLVLDSGSCAGIQPGAIVGEIIVGENCFEYDISGSGFPQQKIPEMKLPSAFKVLDSAVKESLWREVVENGRTAGFTVRVGDQACGEYLIQSLSMREALFSLFHVSGSNWETAGVFVAALKSIIPPLSIRIVTDLGNENALQDFRKNVKRKSRDLYCLIHLLVETGWFSRFMEKWTQIDKAIIRKLPSFVLP